jgi:hypothetical protein
MTGPRAAESVSLPTCADDSGDRDNSRDSADFSAASSNVHKRHAHDAVAAATDAPHSEVALDRATSAHSDIDPRLQVMIDGWD